MSTTAGTRLRDLIAWKGALFAAACFAFAGCHGGCAAPPRPTPTAAAIRESDESTKAAAAHVDAALDLNGQIQRGIAELRQIHHAEQGKAAR